MPRRRDLAIALITALFFALTMSNFSPADAQGIREVQKKSARDVADSWAKKKGGDKATWADSYWPDEFLMDVAVGKNKTPAMAKILLRIENQLRSIYEHGKIKGCQRNAVFAAWNYVKDRNSLFGNNAAKKFGINFVKDVVTLPKTATEKVAKAGAEAFGDKVKSFTKDKAKEAAKKALDEARKVLQGQPPELFDDNMVKDIEGIGDILKKLNSVFSSSSTATRCNISMRVVWNKKTSRYDFLLVINKCKCKCNLVTGKEKRENKVKAMVISGSGGVKLVQRGKAAAISVSRPRMLIKSICCGQTAAEAKYTGFGGASVPDTKKRRTSLPSVPETKAEEEKEPPTLTHEEKLAADKARAGSSIQTGNSDADIQAKADKYRKRIKDAQTERQIDEIGRDIANDLSDAGQRANPDKRITDVLGELTKEVRDRQKEIKKAEEQRKAEQEKKDKVSLSEMQGEADALFASLETEPLLLCPPPEGWWVGLEPVPGDTVFWREPFSFQTVVREPKECVGTQYTVTVGEGYTEGEETPPAEPVIVYVPPETPPEEGTPPEEEIPPTSIPPEEGTPPEEETPPVTTDIPVTETPETETPPSTPPEEPVTSTPPEEPETPTEPTPEETVVTEVPETPDLGLVKAEETIVELALAGGTVDRSVSGAIVKLLPTAPPLPQSFASAQDGSDSAIETLQSEDFYASDVASGITNDNGIVQIPAEFGRGQGDLFESVSSEIELAGLFEEVEEVPDDLKVEPTLASADDTAPETESASDDASLLDEAKDALSADQLVTQDGALDTSAEMATSGFPKKLNLQVNAKENNTTPVVVGLQPSEEEPEAKMQQLLSGAGVPDAPILRNFAVGDMPVFVVGVPTAGAQSVRQFLAVNTSTYFAEQDPCRNKEAEEDPHYEGAGLWGQDFDNQWAIKRVGFNTSDEQSAWSTLKDQALTPVTVAVIDTGVDWYHPDLPASSLWENKGEIAGNDVDDDGNGYVDDVIGWNFVRQNNLPWDYDGHGTFVSGVIAAQSDNGKGIRGINPAAKVMVLKALDEFGNGHASMVAEAIVYAADHGARIINLSLGGRLLTEIEKRAVAYAKEKGAVIVAAAGNSGAEAASYAPAGLEGVVTVSATDRQDKRAGFSNWGPEVDIAAPGVDVLSLRARDTDILVDIPGVRYQRGQGIVGDDRAYFRASGTSFAAPIVAGTLSLMLSKNPELESDALERMVLNAANDIDTRGVDNYTGFGLLNATKALTADPDYFIESRITGVQVVRIEGKAAVRLIGTASANDFAEASILLGQGKEPEKWLTVRKRITEPVDGAALMDLPAGAFRGSKEWIIRLITKHKNGMEREARFSLSLG